MGKLLFIFLITGGLIVSCSKDKESIDDFAEDVQEHFEDNYFSLPGAIFTNGALPESNSTDLKIISITGNSTVIAGGSNIIKIEATGNTSHIIAGILGEDGYYTIPTVSSENGNSVSVDLHLLISRQTSDHYVIAFSATDGDDNYSDYEYIEIDLQEAGIGELQISLTWDQLNDVDLHLIQPDGQHIYYGDRLSTNGGWLDLDSNPACYLDEVNNENIFYAADEEGVTIQSGEYEVLVDLWANCEIEGETNYAIVAYYGDQIIATTEGENPHYGALTIDDESYNTNLISVMKFVIEDADVDGGGKIGNREFTGLAPQNPHRVATFSYDKNNKVFENYNVKN